MEEKPQWRGQEQGIGLILFMNSYARLSRLIIGRILIFDAV